MRKVNLSRDSQKFLKQQKLSDKKRLANAIEGLCDNPHPSSSKRLKGEPYYRLRVGDFRIVYQIENEELLILVVIIARRGEVYKKLGR